MSTSDYNSLPPVTVTITTCNRLILTQETLHTFFQFNQNVHVQAFKMVVDCFNSTFAKAISQEFPNVQQISSVTNSTSPAQRVMDNFELLFTQVIQEGTPYWVHLEDDWNFVAPNFIADGVAVLESVGENSNIWMVVGREPGTFTPLVNDTFGWRNASDDNKVERNYSVLRTRSGPAGSYCSFTLNPAVIRVSTARKWELNLSNYPHEAIFSLYLTEKYEAQVAILEKHRYYHTGGGGLSTMKRKIV